jgi:hypothetical protein
MILGGELHYEGCNSGAQSEKDYDDREFQNPAQDGKQECSQPTRCFTAARIRTLAGLAGAGFATAGTIHGQGESFAGADDDQELFGADDRRVEQLAFEEDGVRVVERQQGSPERGSWRVAGRSSNTHR